jgi:hypothetical protein
MDVNSPATLTQLAEDNPEFSEPLTQKRKLQEQKLQLVENRDQFEQVLAQVDEALAQVETVLKLNGKTYYGLSTRLTGGAL